MKIRQGFVSNSSSSSFVVSNKTIFSSPIEIAYHMIMERDWPNDGELLQKLTDMVRSGKITEQTNLSFNSTNYDTYIYHTLLIMPAIAVYTCNNIDWKFPDNVMWSKPDEETVYSGIQEKKFTLIETGFEGIRLGDNQTLEISNELSVSSFDLYCKSCYKEMWLVKNTYKDSIVCPACGNVFCTKDLNNSTNKWKKV